MLPKNPDELGALWLKQGKQGKYMSGTIGDQRVVVFKNEHKEEGSKAPDYRVLRAKSKDELAAAAEPEW